MKISDFVSDGEAPRYFGLYPAIVTSIIKDDKKIGRIEVSFPFLGESGKDVRAMATLCTPYADNDQGFEILPAKDSQVVVGFEFGILQRPYIVGACWNGLEALPEPPVEANDKRLIKSRAKSKLEFDDKQGTPKVTLSMLSGHQIVLDDAGPTLTIKHSGGSSITFEANGDIAIFTGSTLIVTANSVLVNAPSTTHSGTITCTDHTATSITSPLYSQGEGNIW